MTVAYVALNQTQLPSWVAEEEGYFDQNGLNVTLQYIPSGSSPTAGILSGQIQVVVLSEQAIQADLSGADLVYVAAPTSAIFFSLYSTPSITQGQQLKGTKLGVTAVGSATYAAAGVALQSFGLTTNDVTFISISSAPNILAGLESGAVDAGMLSSPTDQQAQQAGMHLLADVSKMNATFPSGWPVVSKAYVTSHKDVVQRYVQSLVQAIAFEMQNPQQTEAILGKYTNITDPSILDASYQQIAPHLNKTPDPDPQAVQSALQALSVTLPAAASADPQTFIDDEFVQTLKSNGFIDSLYR